MEVKLHLLQLLTTSSYIEIHKGCQHLQLAFKQFSLQATVHDPISPYLNARLVFGIDMLIFQRYQHLDGLNLQIT